MSGHRSSRQRYLSFVADHRHEALNNALGGGTLKDVDSKARQGPADSEPSQKSSGKQSEHFHKYMRWLWPYRYQAATFFVLALLSSGLQMVEPLFMRHIVDHVLLKHGLKPVIRLMRINLFGTLFFLLVAASGLLGALRDYQQRLLNARVTLALRRSVFERLLYLPLPKLCDMKIGGILSRLTGDVDTTAELIQMAFVSPSMSLARLAFAVTVLTALNWRLAIAASAIIPTAVLISFIFVKRVRPIYRSLRTDAEQIDGRVGEIFAGIRIVRAFRRETFELLDYMRGRHTIMRKELFAQRRDLSISTSWNLLLGFVNVAIVWYGGYLNLSGRASIGDIMAFQWYSVLLLNPVWSMVNSLSQLQRSLAAMERVFEVLAMQQDKPDSPDAHDAPSIVREIRFESVEFSYREGCPVVRDFSVVAQCGSMVALVGRSGAGKTTVTDLVARFHDPTKGRILLNGCDIRNLRLHSYRGLIALVQQNVFLFDGSVRDNIAYGRQDVTDADIEAAAHRANAHEFIIRLPEGYKTIIGERGVQLSGGQQQRLAISRAFLASPQILILDEATSNLDTESEELIQTSMAALLAGRTAFVIAHRLSTVRRADLILVMEDGRIVERGTHNELMRVRGIYYDMVIRQMQTHERGGESVLQ